MLVIEKIDGNMINVRNTKTKTPFRIPSHWLATDIKFQEGDVIKVIKDEVSTKRLKKEVKESNKEFENAWKPFK